MPESCPKTSSQQSSDSNPTGDDQSTVQRQEDILQLQRALELESTLRRISDRVRASLEEDHIVKIAVQELAFVLEADCYASLTQPSTLAQPPLAQPPLAQSPDNAKTFLFCYSAHPSPEKSTWFTCPICSDDDQLGYLWVQRAMPGALIDSEVFLVQQIAIQCAIAIHHARLYQAAQTQVEKLKHLNEAKDDFLNQVTHDLRSPLANMRLAIHMLEHQLTTGRFQYGHGTQQSPTCSKTLMHLKVLQTECEREIHLINDLLDLQRLESDQQPLPLEDAIDFKDWLPDLIQPFGEHVQQRQLTLEMQLAVDLPTLTSDSASLRRVLLELLHNACKYTPPHETISIHVSSHSEQVEIQVSNSGVEIPVEELPRIFDKFYRVPGSDHWKQGGTGLGLALVKETITRLGGSIHVESKSGKTCFAIHLPLG